MSTKKLLAREVVVRYPHPQNKYYLIVDYPKCYFLAEDGTKYRFDFNRELKAGDKSFIVKRLNTPNHSMYWQYEIYPVTIQHDPVFNRPKLWFGNGRYLVRKLEK